MLLSALVLLLLVLQTHFLDTWIKSCHVRSARPAAVTVACLWSLSVKFVTSSCFNEFPVLAVSFGWWLFQHNCPSGFFLQGHTAWLTDRDLLFTSILSPPPRRSVQHLLLCCESHSHGRVRKHIIFTKSSTCGKNEFPLFLYEPECFGFKIKNSGWGFRWVHLSCCLWAPQWQLLHCHSWEIVSHYLHFYWCSKLQIAFSSFCLCLCIEEKKTLICWSRPYINHYCRVKWAELVSELSIMWQQTLEGGFFFFALSNFYLCILQSWNKYWSEKALTQGNRLLRQLRFLGLFR